MNRRLLWTTIVSALLALCLWSRPAEGLTGGREWIVGIHNAYRRLIGLREGFTVGNMKKMRWDNMLAAEASAIASSDRITDIPEPPLDRMGIPTRGVNVAIGKGHANIVRFMFSWYEERKYYHRKYNVCHLGRRCEHYMQLASAETDRVGCALRKSKLPGYKHTVSIFVCVYSPGLNLADPIFKIGERCTLCSRPSAFCELGLCTDCDPSRNSKCECRKDCRSVYGYGVLSKHTCTCHCIYGHGPNCNQQCRNPEMYVDYDICAEVTDDDCRSDDHEVRAMLDEFCPEQCTCRAMPSRD